MAKKKTAKSAAPKKAAKKADTPVKKAKKRKVEQYDHPEAERLNNPPVGLVTPESEPLHTAKKTYEYDPHLDPQLVWAGKAEHTSFQVPTVSLHVHERIDPRTIIEAVKAKNGNGHHTQRGLFDDPEEQLPRREAIEFYKHKSGWSNRLVAGDSLLVMNSLLEKEGMAGKVQMVYIDPPYGIRYGSNFQPFVHQRDVKDRKDQDLTAEPEMLRAFRDTWELGIHSYLTYLRDRLLLARELLHESGSVFVQISDENLHHVRELMDEVFGSQNMISIISFVKTTSATTNMLASVADYLIWYGRDIGKTKYRQLYLQKELSGAGGQFYSRVLLKDGTRRALTSDEATDTSLLPEGARIYRLDNLISQSPGTRYTINFNGRQYYPTGYWKTDEVSMDKVLLAERVEARTNSLAYVRLLDDFPV